MSRRTKNVYNGPLMRNRYHFHRQTLDIRESIEAAARDVGFPASTVALELGLWDWYFRVTNAGRLVPHSGTGPGTEINETLASK